MLKKLLSLAIFVILLIVGYDAGKHLFLKNRLEIYLAAHPQTLATQTVSFVFKPFSSSVVMRGLTTSHGLTVESVTLHQELTTLKRLSFTANTPVFSILSAQAITGRLLLSSSLLDWKGDGEITLSAKECTIQSPELTLPRVTLTASSAKVPWTYTPKTRILKVALTIEDILAKGSNADKSFALNGSGTFDLSNPLLEGSINLNAKRLPNLIFVFENAGILAPSQTKILSFGFSLLGSTGDYTPLPISLKAGTVFLGPIPLFQIKQG